MKTKEFICALSNGLRFYTLSALQVILSITILPALLVVMFIIWIDQIKND